MTGMSAFRRSRIYAEGWNAARAQSPRTATAQKPENPYTAEPERSRWNEGYANAQRNNRQVRFTPSRVSADPAAK